MCHMSIDKNKLKEFLDNLNSKADRVQIESERENIRVMKDFKPMFRLVII